uniref:Uncharacterized protein n=1 Tax=viral metagenome TaxID=1070528 RepID=A0A6M3J1H9_9ZZZZ
MIFDHYTLHLTKCKTNVDILYICAILYIKEGIDMHMTQDDNAQIKSLPCNEEVKSLSELMWSIIRKREEHALKTREFWDKKTDAELEDMFRAHNEYLAKMQELKEYGIIEDEPETWRILDMYDYDDDRDRW